MCRTRTNTLAELLSESEKIQYFATTDGQKHGFICERDTDIDRADISGLLEDTLHRALEARFTMGEIYTEIGALIPTDEEMDELMEFDEYVSIDLGYVIPSLISHLL